MIVIFFQSWAGWTDCRALPSLFRYSHLIIRISAFRETNKKFLKFFIYFNPGLLIKQLLSMYMKDARFKDKGKGFEITQGGGWASSCSGVIVVVSGITQCVQDWTPIFCASGLGINRMFKNSIFLKNQTRGFSYIGLYWEAPPERVLDTVYKKG